eukprot:jgi/Bigna1/139262/aug1.49_g13970
MGQACQCGAIDDVVEGGPADEVIQHMASLEAKLTETIDGMRQTIDGLSEKNRLLEDRLESVQREAGSFVEDVKSSSKASQKKLEAKLNKIYDGKFAAMEGRYTVLLKENKKIEACLEGTQRSIESIQSESTTFQEKSKFSHACLNGSLRGVKEAKRSMENMQMVMDQRLGTIDDAIEKMDVIELSQKRILQKVKALEDGCAKAKVYWHVSGISDKIQRNELLQSSCIQVGHGPFAHKFWLILDLRSSKRYAGLYMRADTAVDKDSELYWKNIDIEGSTLELKSAGELPDIRHILNKTMKCGSSWGHKKFIKISKLKQSYCFDKENSDRLEIAATIKVHALRGGYMLGPTTAYF